MAVAFFDVDGTLTSERVWRAYMAYFQVHGIRRWTHRLFWAWHTPLYLLFKRGLISETTFRTQWAAHLAWYVHGWPVEEARKIWDWAVEVFLKPHWRAASVARLKAHLEKGDTVVLVSAAPEPLVRRIGTFLGTPHVVATRLEVRNGRYTGDIVPPVCIDAVKPQAALTYLEHQGIPFKQEEAWAYADAISDRPLLELVGHPVATFPEPDLEALARERGWEILK